MEIKYKISVIIPFHNASMYLDDCIKSLLNQTYKNFEAIFVNDGSTDNSNDIISKYKDNRIKIINIKKSGVSFARNRGLSYLTGDYISFLDVDDQYKPNYLKLMIEAAYINRADVVLCDYTEVYGDKLIDVKLPWTNKLINKEEVMSELIPALIAKNGKNDKFPPIRALVWRTLIDVKFFSKIKIYFNEKVFMAEDLLFLTEIYANADKIYILSESLYFYNRYQNTTMSSYKENFLEYQDFFHKELINILKKYNLFDNNLSRYANNRLIMYKSLIANIIRNTLFSRKQKMSEISKVTKYYEKDIWVKKIKCALQFKDILFIILLKLQFNSLLYIMFRLKDSKERKKLLKK